MIDLEQFIIDRITQFRLKMHMTQKEVGQIMKVSCSFIGNVENPKSNAKYNLRHIKLLADEFKLKPSYFFLSDAEYRIIVPQIDKIIMFPPTTNKQSNIGKVSYSDIVLK
jgi:transcriptional regulator with XRE-family HTH domain